MLTYIAPAIIATVAYGKIMIFVYHRKIPGSQSLPEIMLKKLVKSFKRSKTCKRIVRVLLLFIVLHLPSTVVTVLLHFRVEMHWTPPHYMRIVSFHAEIIRYLNSAINPILFCIIDPSFRMSIRMSFTRNDYGYIRKRSRTSSSSMFWSTAV